MSTRPDPLPKPDRVCVSGLTDCGYSPTQIFTCAECDCNVCWCSGGNEDDLCAECVQAILRQESKVSSGQSLD